MKKTVFPLLFIILLAACSKDEPVAPKLEVAVKQIEIAHEGGNKEININSNLSWSAASSNTEWVTIAPASGSNDGTIKVTIAPNPTLEEREATITIKSEGFERTITVTQDPSPLKDLLTNTKWELISQGSGDPNYDDLIGALIEFKNNTDAVANLNIEVEDVGIIEKIEGKWKVDGKKITINGDFGGIPATLLLM